MRDCYRDDEYGACDRWLFFRILGLVVVACGALWLAISLTSCGMLASMVDTDLSDQLAEMHADMEDARGDLALAETAVSNAERTPDPTDDAPAREERDEAARRVQQYDGAMRDFKGREYGNTLVDAVADFFKAGPLTAGFNAVGKLLVLTGAAGNLTKRQRFNMGEALRNVAKREPGSALRHLGAAYGMKDSTPEGAAAREARVAQRRMARRA